MNITETYTGSDATLEILIMLLVSFLLGALVMWLYDNFLFESIDDNQGKIDEPNNSFDEVKDRNYEEEDLYKTIEEFKNKPKVVIKKKDDDLKIIEGVGPKIESILKLAGLNTLEDISNVSPDQIRQILREKGGERYAFHDPSTWPDQARLAHDGREDELKEYQDFLSGGKMA